MFEVAASCQTRIPHRLEEHLVSNLTSAFMNDLSLVGNVVEVGSGNGWLSRQLTPQWRCYRGIESNEFTRFQAQKLRQGRPDCEYMAGSLRAIPLEEMFADCMIYNFSLGRMLLDGAEVRHQLVEAIAEMLRVARPGAKLVIVDRSGGAADGWSRLLEACALASGYETTCQINDLWIEVFATLGQYAHVESMERLRFEHRFADMEEAVGLSQALAPALLSGDDALRAMGEFYHRHALNLNSEALAVVASIKCD